MFFLLKLKSITGHHTTPESLLNWHFNGYQRELTGSTNMDNTRFLNCVPPKSGVPGDHFWVPRNLSCFFQNRQETASEEKMFNALKLLKQSRGSNYQTVPYEFSNFYEICRKRENLQRNDNDLSLTILNICYYSKNCAYKTRILISATIKTTHKEPCIKFSKLFVYPNRPNFGHSKFFYRHSSKKNFSWKSKISVKRWKISIIYIFLGAFENYLEFSKNDLHTAPTIFFFEPEKLPKLKIEALFRHVFVYTDIVKSIHSSLRYHNIKSALEIHFNFINLSYTLIMKMFLSKFLTLKISFKVIDKP
ncbi:Uncharacterized protein FWK35_00020783 [Aphis craccivora]|uniref:Uncharacterized protein n=1 Tax=Aphis craccivora TaxID=307492 RepID=A0A6G0WG29_APHCR|nr:Uncharacterized protein FWK35_00020783 [Aphis craccivora]